MNSVVIYCCISILFWIVIIFYLYKLKKDALHIGILFIMFYLLNYPFKMIATKFGIAVINSNIFGDEAQILAMVLSDIAALCFTMPLLFVCTGTKQERQTPSFTSEGFTLTQIKFSVIALFIAIILFQFLANGGDSIKTMFSINLMKLRQSQLNNMRIGRGSSAFFSLAAQISQYIIIYLYVFNWRRLRLMWKGFFGVFLVFIMWYGYAMEFSKQTTLFPILLIIVLYNVSTFFYSERKKINLQKIMILGVLGLLLIAFVGFLRAFKQVTTLQELLMNMLRQFSFAFDAPDNLTAILSRMDNIWLGDFQLKPILLNSLIVFIPRSIWPGKPLLQGQMYIMSYYLKERYNGPLGEVISSSIPGELLTSGGIVCMIVVSVLMGCFFGYLYHRAYHNKNSIICQIVYAYSVIQLNSFCRSGTATISGILFFMICAKCFLICYKLFMNTFYKVKKNNYELTDQRKEKTVYVCN